MDGSDTSAPPDGPPTGTGGSGTGGSGTGDGGSADPCATGARDCIPRPATPSPPNAPTTPAAPTVPGTGGGGGGGPIGWITRGITDAINSFFRGLVTAALNPLLDLLGRTLLTTPKPSDIPAIGQLWSTSWEITVAAYSLLIMIGGVTVMAFGSVQTRTSLKDIAPRIPLGFLAAGLSQLLAGKAIELVNPLPAAILGQGVDPDAASHQLRDVILAAVIPTPGGYDKDLYLIVLGLFLAGSLVALLCTYIARVTILVALVGAAPLLLAGHALPQTDGVARWWWRAFGALLAIQIAQSFVLIAAFRVFFTPGGFTLLGPTPNGLVNLLASITLIYLLFKIPFWLLQSARIGNGRGMLGRVVRAYVMGHAFGVLGGGRFGRGVGRAGGRGGRATGGGWGGGRGGGGRGGRGGRPGGGGPADPYDHVEADPNGQLLLPLTRVPRVRRPGPARGVPRPPRPAGGAPRRPGHRQLALPFDQAVGPGGRYLPAEGGTWIDRDGQYLLPFEVDHIRPRAGTRTSRGSSTSGGGVRPAAARPAGPRGRQLALPFDPYQGIRPDRTGQYALPLEGLHRRSHPSRPAVPAPPPVSRPTASPRPAATRYQQLLLPGMPRRSHPHPSQPGQ
ncbi:MULTISPECIES: hypothetical protein [unclassified Frankia]|uniref:hypothetical protein n=1 Tax=unclassified Frankia TaxID=2632575 RepID=UPI002AD2C325|nr:MULTISPECIES: hypothetical protein [unclassified Frankia]